MKHWIIFILLILSVFNMNAQTQYFELKEGEVFETEQEAYKDAILVKSRITYFEKKQFYVFFADVYKSKVAYNEGKGSLASFAIRMTNEKVKDLKDDGIEFWAVLPDGSLGFTDKALELILLKEDPQLENKKIGDRWKQP